MKTFIIFITIFLVTVMVTSSPIDHPGAPIEHSVQRRTSSVKGGRPDVKGYPTPAAPYLNVRKGEYVCGNRICKLKPGEVPKGCNGICQYPIF